MELKKYDYRDITKRKLENNKLALHKDIENQIHFEQLKEHLYEILENKGKVYFITKNKQIYGVVTIMLELHTITDFELDFPNARQTTEKIMDELLKINSKVSSKKDAIEKVNAYALENIYLAKDLEECEYAIKTDIMQLLKEASVFNDLHIKAIIWKDEILIDKTIGKTNESSIGIGMCFGMCFGLLFGVVFDNIAFGMLIGMGLGMALGATYFSSGKNKNK